MFAGPAIVHPRKRVSPATWICVHASSDRNGSGVRLAGFAARAADTSLKLMYFGQRQQWYRLILDWRLLGRQLSRQLGVYLGKARLDIK